MQNPYKLKRDNLQWMLVKVGTTSDKSKNPGKETEVPIGYYPKLEQAALRMQEQLFRDNCQEQPELAEIKSMIEKSNRQVIEAVKEVIIF